MSFIKIHLSNHTVGIEKKISDTQIPLAFLHADEKVYSTHIVQTTQQSAIRRITPYEKFDSYDSVFFKSLINAPTLFDDLIPIKSGDYLKRLDNSYIYTPKESVKFEPYHFSYSVTGQRNFSYTGHDFYNLKVGCIAKNKLYIQSLLRIFGNASERHIAPNNIYVNNKDMHESSLTSNKMSDNDFIFIETENGKTMLANNQDIPYDELLNAHTNIWLCYPNIKTLESGVAKLKESLLYTHHAQMQEDSFTISSLSLKNLPKDPILVDLFSSQALGCAVLHYPGKGYIIVSHENLVLNSNKHYQIIYEVLMQIYLKSYLTSKPHRFFVTDYAVDYTVKNNIIIPFENARTPQTYYEMLGATSPYAIKLVTVNYPQKEVSLQDSSDYIYFSKKDGKKDPEKLSDMYAIYLETFEIMYIKEWHYIVNTPIIAHTSRNGDYMMLTVLPFCNNHVLLKESITIPMPLTQTINYEKVYFQTIQYLLVYRHAAFCIITKDNLLKQDIALLEIKIYLKDESVQIIDMRQRGGGLPLNKKDNYFLFDIGHHLGKLFRKGGAYIVYLPLDMKKHHERILETLQKYGVSDHYFSIIYEKREEDIFETKQP